MDIAMYCRIFGLLGAFGVFRGKGLGLKVLGPFMHSNGQWKLTRNMTWTQGGIAC